MENLSKVESLESFQISKQAMSKVTGSRSKHFEREGGDGLCTKVIDQGGTIKRKHKIRYNSRCYGM